MDANYRIRAARPDDGLALSLIEHSSFTDPWSPAGFREAMKSSGSFGFVAERGETILGYLFGREVTGEGEILNLAVAAPFRRAGIGNRLLQAAMAWLAERGVREVFLEVRESNQAAQRLYLGNGFRIVGMRAGYYRNPPEGALVLRRSLEEPE
jgi:ribosomal-protein-alanine N-acetyltransferase